MKDKTQKAIESAIDRLANGETLSTNGKISAVNLAQEAGISKATLYRYFDEHDSLRRDYDAIRRRGRGSVEAPLTVGDALAVAQQEIKELRRRLNEEEALARVRAQQLFLLWTDNRALTKKLAEQPIRPSKGANLTILKPPQH